jgi:hypothetical protein
MILDAIYDLIEEFAIPSLAGNVYMHEMPEECTFGVLLMDPYEGVLTDPYLPGYRNTEFRLVVRGPRRAEAIGLAWTLSNLIEEKGTRSFQKGDVLFKRIHPVFDPKSYKRSEGGYVEVEVEFDLVCVILSKARRRG